MRKIALISTFYEKKGGVSKFVKSIENELCKNPQIKTTVISPDKHPKNWPKSRLLIAIKTYKTLLKIKPNEIHCHCTWYLQLGALIYTKLNKSTKIISFKHSDINLKKRSSFAEKIQTTIDLNSTKIIFISEYLKEKWSTTISKKYRNSEHIKGGTNIPPLRHQTNNENNENNENSITYVGLFEYPGKVNGLELLIDSFELYARKYEDKHTTLKIIGDGSLRERVEKKIAASNISSRIKIFRNIDDPTDFYLKSNLHCHITYQDTTPLVILEALSLGTPVLASRECGIPEIDASGLHLVENNSIAIAHEIKKMLKNPPKVKLSHKHSWEEVTKEILNITNQKHSKCRS